MRECFVTDFFALSKRTIDADGFLVAPATIAKAGNVQEYRAAELGLDGDPNRVVRLYRPRDEVEKAAPTFARRPVTNNHPPTKWVTAENWSQFGVGEAAEKVTMDGDSMNTVVTVRNKRTVDAVMSGKAGMSCGYKFSFDDSRKTTPEGVAVDGWMTDIVGNHIAVVDRGRGGPECIIADEENKPMSTKRIVVDGLPLDLDEVAAATVEKLQATNVKLVGDAEAATKMAEEAEKRAVAADAANKELTAKVEAQGKEIEALKATPTAPTQEAIEAAAEERNTVVGDAAVLAPELAPKGKTVDAIRREAITAASAKHETVKAVCDSVLGTVALDKAGPDAVKAIFTSAVGMLRTAKADDKTVAADMLAAGGGGKDKDHVAADEADGLVGQEAYAYKLTHRRQANA
jgi:hypothetical protein